MDMTARPVSWSHSAPPPFSRSALAAIVPAKREPPARDLARDTTHPGRNPVAIADHAARRCMGRSSLTGPGAKHGRDRNPGGTERLEIQS